MTVGLTGCADDPHSPSTRQGILNDRTSQRGYEQGADPSIEARRTAERVREALAAGAEYKYDGVKVIVCEGVVQLSGIVNTSVQRKSAAEVAHRVVGVKSVANNLTVRD